MIYYLEQLFRSWLASALTSLGDIDTAIKFQEETQDQLLNSPNQNDAYMRDRLASTLGRLAELLEYKGDLVSGLDKLLLAQNIIEKSLALDSENEVWKRDLFHVRTKIFHLNSLVNDFRVKHLNLF